MVKDKSVAVTRKYSHMNKPHCVISHLES